MFLIDVLEDFYEFKIIEKEVEIYKKTINSDIKESISHIDFVYAIQEELYEKVMENYGSIAESNGSSRRTDFGLPDNAVMKEFYKRFGNIDALNKSIHNIIYLKKYLED